MCFALKRFTYFPFLSFRVQRQSFSTLLLQLFLGIQHGRRALLDTPERLYSATVSFKIIKKKLSTDRNSVLH